MDAFVLDPANTRDISGQVLDANGRLRILPAAYWASTIPQERAMFGYRHGIYSFPTIELVDHLQALIGGRKAIEIGAGNGVLAEALGITATDSRQQEREPWRTQILALGQPVVPYGPNVLECHATRAVRLHKPAVVIGCWVTHKYRRSRHYAGGYEGGIDEREVLRECEEYVIVGNERVHQHKEIWDQPHTISYPSFVFSLAQNGTRDFIAVWPGRKASWLRP